MKRRLLSILVALAVMVTFMPAQTLTVAAASKAKTKATVSTQTGLKKALKNKKLKTLNIRTSKKRSFVIAKGSHKKVSVNYSAANSNIKNSSRFKTITINRLGEKTWTEKAKGNTIALNDSNGRINVLKGASVNAIKINKASSVVIDVKGRLTKVNVNAKSAIYVNGTPDNEVSIDLSGNKSVGSSVKNNTTSRINLIHRNGVYALAAGRNVSVLENGHLMMTQVDIPLPPLEPEPEEEVEPVTPGGGGGTPTPGPTPGPSPTPGPTPEPTPVPVEKDPSFKAVYDTNNEANILTFYYDKEDHSGSNIKVYDNLPMNASPESWKSPEMPTEEEFWAYEAIANEVKKVVIDPSVADLHGLKSTYMMFYYFVNCSSITGVEYLDVSQVYDMNWMFASFGSSVEDFNCIPNVSNWDTSSLETADHMFYFYGGNSTELSGVPDVSNWDTSNLNLVQDMFNMYGSDSKKLQFRLDLTKWNVSKLVYTMYMFEFAGYSISDENWQVIIPYKSAGKINTTEYFYVYDGSYAIHPTGDRVFTVAAEVQEELPEELPEESPEKSQEELPKESPEESPEKLPEGSTDSPAVE